MGRNHKANLVLEKIDKLSMMIEDEFAKGSLQDMVQDIKSDFESLDDREFY